MSLRTGSQTTLVAATMLLVAACSAEKEPSPSADACARCDGGAGPSDANGDASSDIAAGGRTDGQGVVDGEMPRPDAGSGPVTISVRIAAPKDVVTSYLMAGAPAWNIFFGETAYLGRRSDGDHASYHAALRFTPLPVPAGVTIQSATLSLYPRNEVDSAHALWINIYAEKRASSPAFDPTNYDSGRPDQRPRTTAKIDHWLVRCRDDCNATTEYDCPQRKLDCWDRAVEFVVPKDLKDLVQEVVNEPGWSSGNALTLLLVNAATDADGAKYRDSRSFTGVDPARGPAFAPQLLITYAPSASSP